ncbi:MAG TPA: glutamate 5-kinase, partial [Ruminococcaceae bacterium]|nr:glutamate 5-kinase [Oscillospiraceae bacterium]
MSHITQAKRIVIKVGTSTLTYETGRLNLRRMEELCKVLCGLKNEGREIILVTSGAVGVGMGKLGLHKRPEEIEQRQAVAAVGQCELMFMYDKFFGEYNHIVAQVLLTKDVVQNTIMRRNAENTFLTLLQLGSIPVVNENDS